MDDISGQLKMIIQQNPKIKDLLNVRFNIAEIELVAELSFIRKDYFSIFINRESGFYILCYIFGYDYDFYDENIISGVLNLLDYSIDWTLYDCIQDSSGYVFCNSFKEVLESINDLLSDVYEDVISFINVTVSNRWWSYLPGWTVLNPYFIDPRLKNEFDEAIAEILSNNDFREFSEDEKEMINKFTKIKYAE